MRSKTALVLAGVALAVMVVAVGNVRAAPATAVSRFPAPPPGATVYHRELGADGLALGVVPLRGRVLAQASVVGRQGEGVSGLAVTFAVQGATKAAVACGAGCYRATLPAKGRPPRVDLVVRGAQSVHWRVGLPAQWPPRDGAALVARARTVWRGLRSLSFTEHLASGTGHVTLSTWRIQAPDRVAYQVKGGWAGVVVGDTRWDKTPNGTQWVASQQTRLTQPIPGWVKVTDAHVLGSTTVRGRPAWRVSFYDPGTPGWFTLLVDKSSFRTYQVRMTATAHFMRDDYGSFNTTPAIVPPR